MPSTTPNFGFEYPLSTDNLSDGAQSIQDFATTADTTFVDLLGGTTGQYLTKNSNTNMDFLWAAAPVIPPAFWPLGSGYYMSNRRQMLYDAMPVGGVLTPSAISSPANFYPLWIPEDMTLDRVGINCLTAVAGSQVQIALYTPNSAFVPTTRLLDAGSVATATTGVKELTISQAVTKGLIFVALRWSTSGIGLRGFTETAGGSTGATDALVPFDSAANATGGIGGGLVWRATGTSPFPATVTPTLTGATGGLNQVSVFIRRA